VDNGDGDGDDGDDGDEGDDDHDGVTHKGTKKKKKFVHEHIATPRLCGVHIYMPYYLIACS